MQSSCLVRLNNKLFPMNDVFGFNELLSFSGSLNICPLPRSPIFFSVNIYETEEVKRYSKISRSLGGAALYSELAALAL